MATLTKGKTFTNGELVTPQKIHELVDLGTVSNIVNADIAAGAAISDTKLATIATAGKVANSATTATNANTASAIVARDASGNFTAGTITAALSGNASSATTAAACSGNAATATTAASCTGNAATATTAASCTGNAATATTLQTARTINGVSFNGSANITVTAAPNAHTHAATDIISGTLVNAQTTATNANTANAIVARDASGNFSAGTITAALSGNASSATTATNLAGGAANSVPYQSAAGNTAMLAVGSAGQVLTSNGSASAPSWQTLSATATNANNITGGNAGEILYQSAAATTAKLAAGTSGQVLRSNGTATPSWITLATSATTDTTNAGNINSGTLAIARIPTGTTATTICIGNDSRLSDSRTPTTHTHAITDTTGLQTALDGKQAAGSYAAASHTHSATDITSGTLAIARIPTGITATTVCIGNDSRLVPAGAIMPFAMNAAPSGWLSADGSPVSRATYSGLFSAISTTYGPGDGSTTFNLPDLRGIFIRGSGGPETLDGVNYSGTFANKQKDNMVSHKHDFSDYYQITISANGASNLMGGGTLTRLGSTGETGATTPNSTDSRGVGTETYPANIALLYCIKF